jgi:prepilin-type N-terminal cleavage/methylation domain-containing protein
MKDKKGFTLTELLAVIVLIGVILAIAVPSYQSYVTRTRKEVLKSYQANIIDAANQYAAECIVKNTLVENFDQKNIWGALNFKNKAAIEKDYDAIEVYIEAGKSKASDLYCIRIKSTKNNSIDYYTTCLGKDSASTSEITIGDKKYTGTSPIIKGGSLVITGNIKEIKVDDNDDNIINCKTRGIQTAKSICNLPQDLKDGEHKITYGDGKTLRFVMDKTSPKIETSNINTSPTNKVEFTVTITDKNLKEVTKFPKECKIEEDKETTKKYICTITENGEYSFSAIDKADNTEAKDITISNITSEKPSVILNIDSEAVSKSKIIEIEYISGSNGNEIGFNTDQKLKWSLINTSNNQEERTGEFTNLSNKGSQKVEINGLTGTYRFIVEGLTNKAGNKNNDEERTIRLDNTPPSAVVVTAPNKEECNNKNRVCEAKCESPDSNGNRACTVEFYGGAVGTPVKAEVNFVVEDVGSSGVGKAYYRTTTTGNFTETTIEAINSLEHKDYLGNKMNLYIEVVFADALGNIDYTKNITKITFIKHKL